MKKVCFLLVAGRTAVQVCAEPHIVNFLSKTFQLSADSPGRKNHQVCTMLEKQMIFGWAVNPTDTEKLFLKLQVRAFVYKLSSFVSFHFISRVL